MMNTKESKMSRYEQVVQGILFGNFSAEQLACLGQALTHARAQLGHQTKRELRIGSVVTFYSSKKGRTFKGTVTAIKRKNVLVLTKIADNKWLRMDTRYTVPAHMLELVA